jgi:hypothetical protein
VLEWGTVNILILSRNSRLGLYIILLKFYYGFGIRKTPGQTWHSKGGKQVGGKPPRKEDQKESDTFSVVGIMLRASSTT